jgi:hypothetical protein
MRKATDPTDLRVKCTFTNGPLTVTIGQETSYTNEMQLDAGVAYEIRIFSRYEYPNGIKLPDDAGRYYVEAVLKDKGVAKEK